MAGAGNIVTDISNNVTVKLRVILVYHLLLKHGNV